MVYRPVVQVLGSFQPESLIATLGTFPMPPVCDEEREVKR